MAQRKKQDRIMVRKWIEQKDKTNEIIGALVLIEVEVGTFTCNTWTEQYDTDRKTYTQSAE